MSNWDEFADMIATLAVATFAWFSSVISADGPAGLPAPATTSAVGQDQLSSVLRWAQQEDEPPIEQVGESTGDDVETLDEAGPPVQEGDATEDVELLDQGPPPEAQEDVELLDQGPPTAPAVESTAPSTVTTEPVTTFVAPAATSGPVVPEGFGTGRVQVSTGTAGFPAGLEDCHVGAVTGRAYVGIGCGDGGGSSFVGHAPTFEDFPFVVDEGFPFNRESVFADFGPGQPKDNVATLISAARGATRDDNSSAPEIRTSGASSVEFEQKARDRQPRAESENGRKKRGKDSRRGETAHVTSSESEDAGDKASTESKQKAKNRGKHKDRHNSTADSGKKGKSSKNAKNNGDKKSQKSRVSN